MDYSYDSHSYLPSRAKHDSFLQPSSRDAYGYSRTSRSSTRLGVPHDDSISRNKSVGERERRPYHPEPEYRSRSHVRREETYPAASAPRAKSARRRRSWPPSPSVEDEDEALKKEHPRRRNPKQSDDEVSMPGTVDQNPVMIELENHDRRFVVVPQDETKTSKPESRRPRRPSDRVPPLKTDLEEPDLLARRKPSPYAFSSTPQSSSSRSNDMHMNQPASGSSSRRGPIMTPPTSDDESRRRPRTSRPTNSSSDERQTDDSDVDAATASKLRERKSKARVSFHEPSLSPRPEYKRFSSDFASPQDGRPKPPAGGPSLLKSALKPQPSSTPSSDDEGLRRRIDTTATPMPRSVPISIPLPQHMRDESGYGSRPSLQELSEAERARDARPGYPGPGSPKITDRTTPSDYYPSNVRSSRPNSPSMSNFDTRDFANNAPPPRSNGYPDVENGYGSSYERRGYLSSRPAPHSRQGSWDSVGSSRNDSHPPPPPPQASALPYPVDDPMIHMPNHEHYIDTPTRENAPTLVPMPSFPNQDYTSSPASSPNLSRNGGEFPPRPRARSNTSSRRPAIAHEAVTPAPAGVLPPCPRMEYSRRYPDWYALVDNHSVDVCPACYDGIIRPTVFKHEFELAPPRSSSISTRCDFGSPWYRAAWLLTLKRGRKDLELVYALATISTVDNSCPGSREGPGPWYGLLGKDHVPIPGFSICSRDFRYIEALFPALVGLFNRLPGGSSGRDARLCSMRVPGDRFGDYLNLLEKIDEEARTVPLDQAPALDKLVKFIRATAASPSSSSTSSKKCPRDRHLKDATWHFMPLLPEFTVCESCFDEVVWPDVKTGSELAGQFHQVLTPLPAGIHAKGTGCQLYSPRMRYIWEQAVKRAEKEGQRDGVKVLARKVRERWEMETMLRAERLKVEAKLDRNKRNVGRLADDIKADCRRQLEEIAEDWAKWE